jgi:hypothetical protein
MTVDALPISVRAMAYWAGGLATLGTLLRVHYIQLHQLWSDETQTLNLVTMPWRSFARWFVVGQDFHPPLYFAWLRIVRAAGFGLVDMQVLRYADLIWLPATLAVAAWFGIRHPRYRLGTIVVGLLIAVGPTFVYLGAELRSYGMLTFLSFTLMVLVIEYLHGRDLAWPWLLLGAAVTLMIPLVHYVGFLIDASLLGAAIIGALVTGRSPWRPLAVGATAALAFVPYSPILLKQLQNQDVIYSTPLPEAASFVARGLNPIGLGTLVVGLIAVVLLTIRYPTAESSTERHPVAGYLLEPAVFAPMVAAILFILTAAAVSLVRDVDLLNFGASLTPVLWLSLGAANLASMRLRAALAVACVALVPFSVALTLSTNQDPSVFEGNRVSTVDVLVEAIRSDPSIGHGFGIGVTLIHVDWYTPNDYFAAEAGRLVPLANIESLPISMWDQLSVLIVDTATKSPGRRIVIVTRLPLDTTVLSQVPAGYQALTINPNVVEVIPGE